MAKKTVLLGGLFHETHTFLHQKTRLDQFRETGINRGEEVISRNLGNGSPTDGFLSYAARQDWRIIPAIQMAASPSGMVTSAAIEYFNQQFFTVLERECTNIDGIFLVLHGAMVSENCADVEGALLKKIQQFLEARNLSLPVAAVLDLHANVSRDMVDFSNCLYSYRKNPHSDAREAAVQTATLFDELMRGTKVSQHHLATPYVIPPTGLGTTADPMRAVLARAREIEAADPDLMCINVMGGYAYADIADCGFSLNCCTRGDAKRAKAYLQELCEVLENHLESAYPLEASLEAVLQQIDQKPRPPGPVLLIEPADNIGGGTPGDGTGILKPLLATGRSGIVAIINDPEAAMLCHDAGAGAQVSLEIGAKTDAYHGQPVAIVAGVQYLSDGLFELENKQSHLASMMGSHIDMGACAVVKNQQATILLTSRKIPPMDLGQLHSQGIRPQDATYVIVKAAVSHKDAYDPIAAVSYYVDSIGLCTSNLSTLPYRNLIGKQIAAK